MPDVLLVFHRRATFIDIDAGLLREGWEVEEWRQPRPFARPLALFRAVRRSRLVFGWFASWHTLLAVTFAWALRKPSVVVVGGFDLARLPEIGYGNQRGGLRKAVTGWILARATRLVVNSHFSLGELATHAGVLDGRATVIHHGVPDPFGSLPAAERERLVLTVGVVDARNLERKGHRLFVETARELPDVRFVLVGRVDDPAAEDELRTLAGPNVEIAGWVADEKLRELLAGSSVYAQPSRHEGFGLAVAEAMLAGCIPVVTRAGALPEVVGDAGVVVEEPQAGALADGIRTALSLGAEARLRARQRVLDEFPLEARRRGLFEVVGELLKESPADGPRDAR